MLSVFVILGYVAPSKAFSGLGHPAVVTVALVLLISKGLEVSGFISIIGEKLEISSIIGGIMTMTAVYLINKEKIQTQPID